MITDMPNRTDLLLRIGLTPEQEKEVFDKAKKMLNGVKTERTEYEADWRELAKYFCPHLLKLDSNERTKKNKWNNIINGTCRTAVRTLAAGMQSGLTSPARPWFKLGLEDYEMMEYGPAREWLQTCTMRMQSGFRRSNFYNTAVDMYSMLGPMGTGARLHLEDEEDGQIFRTLLLGRYWIGNNARGRIDRLFYVQDLTVIQRMEMFGKNNDPATINEYDNGEYFKTVPVWCGIFPNPFAKYDWTGNQIIAANQKPFISVYWKEGHDTPLKTSGYDRFPAQVPRWECPDGEVWGVGPGMDAIGDTKAIQLKEREKAKGIQKMVAPPVSAPQEMRNGQFPINGLPGGVTYRAQSTAPDTIRSLYEVNLPLNYLFQDIAIDENRVNRAFYADLFLMLANMPQTADKMTATEVSVRHEEKLLALGPVIERLGNEFLDPSVERAFEIMLKNNELPEPPPEIQGVALKIEYISVLAQAQQQVGIGAIERFLSFTGNLSQFFPEVKDKVNPDQAIDEVGNMLGVPYRVVATDEEAEKKREIRGQQMAAQQQAAIGAQAVDAAQKLSQTPMEGDTALTRMMAGP